MSVLVVTGTGTGVGKTVVTAAIAALARARGWSIVVVKPVQTGVAPDEAGDLAEVARLTGLGSTVELARYAAALSPAAAARIAVEPPVDVAGIVRRIRDESTADLVLVEGAGGL
ncbi:MAG: AAA family ATPase, partial [Propionibacteriaceae bacterium]